MKKIFSMILAALLLTAADALATTKGLLITHKDGTYTFLLLNREIEMTWKNDQTLHISNRNNIDYDMSIFDMEEFVIAEQPSDVFATITQDGLMLKCKVFDEGLKTMQIGAKKGMAVGLLPSSFVVPQTIHGYSVVGLIDGAFTNCTELKSITIPNHVTSIGNGVFVGCDDLNEIIVDKNNLIYDSRENCQAVIETSSNKLVAGCSKTIIPNSVISIGASALEGCKNMTSIILPNSVTTIGDAAFQGCDALTDVYCYSKSIPSASSTAFNNVNNATLHVPVSLLDEYKKTAPWKNFRNIVAFPHVVYMVDDEIYKTVEYDYGEAIIIEKEPIREGYTFSGWNEVPKTMPDENVIIKGTFAVNSYRLTYMIDGSEYKVMTMDYDSAIPDIDVNSKIGYTFSGWVDLPNLMPAKDVTVNGFFNRNKIGDLTGSGSVNVQDATLAVNFILGKIYDKYDYTLADMNDDGEIDVFDVTMMIGAILKEESAAKARKAMGVYVPTADDLLTMESSSEGMTVSIERPERFTSFQMDVEVPVGVALTGARLTNNESGHNVLYSKIGENQYRLMALSMSSTPLKASANGLLELDLTDGGDVQIGNIMFVTPQGEAVLIDALSDNVVTDINSIGISEVEEIYDLSGRKMNVRREQLPKGVYIINQKKVVIK